MADQQDSLGCLSAFRQALQRLGWSDGGNVRIETRVAKGNPERLRSDSARGSGSVARAAGQTPSIAVLPFQNMSGDSEQEYFADGIVEAIITG